MKRDIFIQIFITFFSSLSLFFSSILRIVYSCIPDFYTTGESLLKRNIINTEILRKNFNSYLKEEDKEEK